jgi:predicted esterase
MKIRLHLVIILFAAMSAVAQQPPKPPAPADASAQLPQPGKIMPAVQVTGRPGQSYALYVPSDYTAAGRWPIIYAFDPAARGAAPLELMKSAAERYGFVLAGSNNSRNGDAKLESEAADAMWSGTHATLAIDDRRVYFAGLSGGARLSAQLAQSCKCASGVFLSSAGFGGMPPSREMPFWVFSTTGMADFNYGELVELDARLEQLGVRHYLRRFNGSHEWAPSAVWEELLGWTAVEEMREFKRERDKKLIEAELTRALDRLKKREDAGEVYYALGEARATIAEFDGLADVSAVRERVNALDKDPKARAGAKAENSQIQRQHAIENDVVSLTSGAAESRDEQSPAISAATMRVARLREASLKEKNPETRQATERALHGVFVGLIETGEGRVRLKDYRAARLYFTLAIEAQPKSAWPHLSLARCHAESGSNRLALGELAVALKKGVSAADLDKYVRGNAVFGALASSPEYRKMLETAPNPKHD